MILQLLVALGAAALAWEPMKPPHAWPDNRLPIPTVLADACPPEFPAGSCLEDTLAALDVWEFSTCNPVVFDFRGVVPTETIAQSRESWVFLAGPNGSMNDLEAGVFSGPRVDSSGIAFALDGITYASAEQFSLVIQPNLDWYTQAAADADGCDPDNGVLLVGTLLRHQLGHVLGLDHPVDSNGQPISGPLMQPGIALTCTSPEPIDDDRLGISTLYGPRLQVTCSPAANGVGPAIGAAPLEVFCTASGRRGLAGVDQVRWSFSDGGEADGISVRHTFTEPGEYTVVADVQGSTDDCPADEFAHSTAPSSPIVVCGEPAVHFELQPAGDLAYTVYNRTDLGPLGCTYNVAWSVYAGEGIAGQPLPGLSSRSWEPTFAFDEPGTYTVVGNVGTIAGTAAARITLDVRRGRGCNTSGTQPWSVLGLLAGLALLARRGPATPGEQR